MKKLAIIGASYLQEPLIRKAKLMGLETHVFAWQVGDVGEKIADYFYPISIVEKEQILEECKKINIDGICSIASDLAMVTVNYVAEKMGLIGNSIKATDKSTNKHLMRKAFEENGDPSPKSFIVDENTDIFNLDLSYPVIVKPTDRSGSRGIFKVELQEDLSNAIKNALGQSFEKKALVEEFAEGNEYSVEYISQDGIHNFLAITKKYTTGAPCFIENGHIEPAFFDESVTAEVKSVIEHALNTLEIKNGASHSEIKIDQNGTIKIIEIGGRMGGDCIGSDLVELSTGVDFVKSVINVALGQKININTQSHKTAAIRFVFSKDDIEILRKIKLENPEILVREDVQSPTEEKVTDSSTRYGYFLISSENRDILTKYLPEE